MDARKNVSRFGFAERCHAGRAIVIPASVPGSVVTIKADPAKTYEANTAAKNKFFDIVEPMGVALAQQVRDDMHEGLLVILRRKPKKRVQGE